MMDIGERERVAQDRVLRLLTDPTEGIGWRYLGDWHGRTGNANIEEGLLRDHLARQGYSSAVAGAAIGRLRAAAAVEAGKLLEANQAVYDLLRYGVPISPGPGEAPITVRFIDWANPGANDFAVAEEVAIPAVDPRAYGKRPDLVLYVNGTALGVIELKRSTVTVGEGIRQNLDNQRPEFIQHFFSTVQMLYAGNDSEGLRYAPVRTPQPYWLAWKENGPGASRLDRDIRHLIAPERFLEIIHDFTLFDGGVRKTCRPNQYFAVKAAQARIRTREGGIIWQTQGSGKSLIMVMLARWIRETIPDGRVLVITDRKELDKQIADDVFGSTGDVVRRARSGADLLAALADEGERIVCTLIHKFGRREAGSMDDFVAQIRSASVGAPKGNFFVFIDECHRTQAGKLAAAMRQILPGAMFIGFTGTPILRSDKATSIEIFGPYIGTPYRFDEAVEDGVILDLRYEARDIDQRVASPEKVDEWFELATKGLTPVARATLKARWGTLQRVLSSRDRLSQIANDIMFDMMKISRLSSGRGNAILVAGSIPEACQFFEHVRGSGSPIADQCAIITSYTRTASQITGEETGMGETDRQYVHRVYDALLTARGQTEEQYEAEALELFRHQPGRMRLLIVVSRLLTGFDAPTASYLYIDKSMQDHGLFQAICRVNRRDDDKDYGYIIDYKDLFRSIEGAVKDYTSEAFEGFDRADVEGLITDRAEKASEDLETAREAWLGLLDPVPQPRSLEEVFGVFSSPDGVEANQKADEKARLRQQLYTLSSRFARAFEAVAESLDAAGYGPEDLEAIRAEVDEALSIREAVRLHSGDAVDLKLYEPDMRRLINTYVRAEPSKVVSSLDDLSLVELIAGHADKIEDVLPESLRGKRENVAETIENNVRRLIIDETPVNPKFYEKMSALLIDLVNERRAGALDYAEYLKRIAELARLAKLGHETEYPASISSPGMKALFDNLGRDEELALRVDYIVRTSAKDGFRGDLMKQRRLKAALSAEVMDPDLVGRIYDIVAANAEY